MGKVLVALPPADLLCRKMEVTEGYSSSSSQESGALMMNQFVIPQNHMPSGTI